MRHKNRAVTTVFLRIFTESFLDMRNDFRSSFEPILNCLLKFFVINVALTIFILIDTCEFVDLNHSDLS
jgi:hypothetical protein